MPIEFPSSRKIRLPNLKHGLGLDFWVAAHGAGFALHLYDGAANRVSVLDDGGGLRAEIARPTLGTLQLWMPSAGSPYLVNDGQLHHYRLSIRKDGSFPVLLSFDGSEPVFAYAEESPTIFDPSLAGVTIALDGYGRAVFDSINLWDGWHAQAFDIPVDSLPPAEQWIP
jgi:hypothetical protein